MGTFRAALVCTLLAAALGGCKNDIFSSKEIGHGPNEYEIFTDRTPRSVHQGEQTSRAGVMILPPIQPLDRSAARQKEVLTAMQQFYEKLFSIDERRAKDSVKWLQNYLEEHRGLAPDQPVAIQNALDQLTRTKERAAKAIQEAPNDATKANIAEGVVKIDKEIEFFQKYNQDRTGKVAQYQAYVDSVDAANKRIQMWQARHTRMGNTAEWVRTTGGSADAELNRAMREMADLLNHEDDQTRLETLAMIANLGGGDAKQMLPSVKAVAADTKSSPEVRAFAAKAGAAIEAQGG